MANLKWIYFVVLFEHLLTGTTSQTGGGFVFPENDAEVGNAMRKYQSNWQTGGSSAQTGSVRTVKTTYVSSSRMGSDSAAQANAGSMSLGSAQGSGGSASQANAGSSSYNYAPAYFNGPGPSGSSSGSSASASASSFSSGVQCAEPEPPVNGRMSCSMAGCQISCLPDYRFPVTGATTLTLSCMNGRWMVKDMQINEIPKCEAICLPACKNNGICIAPGQCRCPQNFMGPTCQFEKKLCLKPPPLPANARRSCTDSLCSVSCMKGYKFPDGSLSMNLQCINGEWLPERQDLQLIPGCEPICDPPCINGGNCLSYNVCQCTKDFRGAQCQWGTERCATAKMNFNGGFKCSGTADAISCKLSCPKGVSFEFEPAEFYTCAYGSAEFLPKQVPRCVYADGMQVIQSKPVENYSQTNGTIIRKSGRNKVVVQQEEDGEDEEEVVEQTIITKKTIRKKGGKKTYTVDEDEEFFQAPGVYSLYMTQEMEVSYKTPKPSVCMTWNGNKIKTFDGVSFTHELICSHTLLQDYVDGTFDVILRACPFDSTQPCPHALEVFMQNEQYTFENDGGQVKMFTTKREIPIPVQMTGLKVTRSGTDVRIVLEQIPITITWDSQKFVQIDATESIWNRTAGICGTMDGIMSNDFMSKDGAHHKMASTFVDSWRALSMDKNKQKCIVRSQQITAIACDTSIEEKANLVCTDLMKNPKMKNCLKMFHDDILMKNCISDYCDCKNSYERTECICNGISALAKDCRFRGVMLDDGWRDWQICPLNCTNGRVYKSCGPLNEPSCGSAIESDSFNCREGCFCPEGTMLNDGACVKEEMCPCKLKGKTFPPKSQITRDCNTCSCENGNWKCTTITCGARCAAVGDPHYVSFDGKRYDFMGKCSYYLMKAVGISVEAENVACSGAISENMNFLPSVTTELPSCTKSLTIKFDDDAGQQRTIKLKQGGLVLLDGYEVTKLPRELSNGAVKIRQASSSFVIVDFQDGATVWWDGATRAYIDAPASYRGKTQGLCGTFNSNMQDDFLTPEGDIETTVHPFANKWQTKETCDFLNDKIVPHPCQVNLQNKVKAEKMCAKLREKVFEDCHLFVDPEEFYEDCLYDACACKGDVSQCFCPIFASYAAECARQGTVLEWRYRISECAISCPNGQVFQQCGEACTRTCSDLQSEAPCKLQCVEGCRCPMGQVLDENNECVTVEMCKCAYKGMEFQPGYKEVRPGRRFQELCSCYGGRWKCVEARGDDAIRYPAAGDISKKCSATRNEMFTACEPAEPVTCKNMHANVSSSTANCRPGCQCKDGFVLDTMLKQCVLPEQCSCHHGGKSYSEGERIREDCNTCLCKAGKWGCTTNACESTCSAWGDSHFTTFDGREFDFQGVCSYVLAKGKLSDGDGFSVTIQNVLCGSNGVTCSKSLEINLVGNEMESIALSSDQAEPGIKSKLNAKPLKKMFTYRSGIFIIVEIPHVGVSLKWDRGTRVYLKLENRWKGRVQGLCGNYNYDALDDFMNPSLGVESNPIIFGHSWKLEDSCSMPTELVDSCALNPQRKTWAQRKCGLLKSAVFARCHSEVSFESFYKRCIFDTCSCDQGGDCECLCTALSAYAFACSAKGIFIKWRTPDLCPMQCDPTCSNYQPCISPCPTDNCDNLMQPQRNERLCNSDVCVEGCKLKDCPAGQVYSNSSYMECVPKSACKPICLEELGVAYYEGDVMSSDACHTCKCTRGSKVCTGLPCSIDVPDAREADMSCVTGWSEWMNQDVLDQQAVKSSKSNYFKEDDMEPLPDNMQMKNMRGLGKAVCSTDFFAAVECRTVVGHDSPKKTGQNVECSLERGLLCKGQCFDFEIRVYCECGDLTKVASTPKPSTQPPQRFQQKCPPGSIWSECATPCNRACNYFDQQLKLSGNCTRGSNDCIPGCVPIGSATTCEYPKMWRDWQSCVDIQTCTCVGPNNEILKPGQVVYVSDCKTCQCLNNEYICANVPCQQQPSTLRPLQTIETVSEVLQTAYYLTLCDEKIPHIEHPKSCYKFLHCMPARNGSFMYAVKTCYPNMMYNPQLMICDWPATVKEMKPKCARNPGETTIEIWETEEEVWTRTKTTRAPIVKQTPAPQVIEESGGVERVFESQESVDVLYYISKCHPSAPQKVHPKSCYKFLRCTQSADGSYAFSVKTCYPSKMFNPKTLVCDLPSNVKAIKPKCGYDVGEVEIWETEETIISIKKSQLTTTTRRPLSKVAGESEEVGFAGMPAAPYYIRLCDPTLPYIEHPESCYKYLQCSKLPNGSYAYTEKTCGADMMFNPGKRDCDWPEIVITSRPMCREKPGEIEILDQKTAPPTVPVPTARPYVIPSTLTPPMSCDQGEMVPLLDLLPDSAFTASSILGPYFKPESGRFDTKANGKSSGSWSPKTNDLNQFLQVAFPHAIPVYGVIVRGNPMFDQYVTSFKILHSHDGNTYHALEDNRNRLNIFSGSADSKTPVKSIFPAPIEAKFIRIYPISWYSAIALRVELLGCQKPSQPEIFTSAPVLTTTSKPKTGFFGPGMEEVYIPAATTRGTTRAPFVAVTQPELFAPPPKTRIPVIMVTEPPLFGQPTTRPSMLTEAPIQPMCDDPLGVENSKMSANQISFSSIKDVGTVKTKVRNNALDIIKLSSPRGWIPLTNNMKEFVMFNFIENRRLTGVITKGGEYGWVKTFNVLYSKDNVIWNKVLDAAGNPREFLGNVDSESVKKNLFDNPINAQYMKIQPTKWSGGIELKLEPIGCYLPYPKITESATTRPKDEVEIVTPSTCGLCTGVMKPRAVDGASCTCYPPLYWNGNDCVPQTQCPCVEGHMMFEIGETYQTESCSDCICKIGGIPDCKPKVCGPCGKGLRRESPGTCSCKCVKCPPDSVLCPTSGECIPESSWCDGVQDCPDDEMNCAVTVAPHIEVNRTESIVITKKCPDPTCPPGFRMKEKKAKMAKMSSRFSDSSETDDSDRPEHQYYYVKAKYQASYEAVLPISTNSKQQDVNSEECFEFVCIPIVDDPDPDYSEGNQRAMVRCPEPKCPKGYMIRLQIQKDSNGCAQFSCEPITDNDAVCNVTGRTFNTFDSTEFKYDICNHLLARDVGDAKWNVIMRKNCSSGNNICSKEIEIKDKVSKYTLILYPSLSVNLDGYYFTVQQLQNSNRKMSFTVSKNGDNLLYVSHAHGIWLTFDQFGDVKLGISSQYVNQVDGLCGFYSDNKAEDKRTPAGVVSPSTVIFGDSWSVSKDTPSECEPHVCPKILQDAAWTMCNLVKEDIFQSCHAAVDPTRFISKCLETACDCLLTATNGSTALPPKDMLAFTKDCKCSVLKKYVVECMAADETVHLETWRSAHSCEAKCPVPFVHHDCFRRKCETTCSNIQSSECTNVPGTCFSGCYCPSGTVRKDSTCIPISECRDCVCDGFGKSQYLTYDRKNFTFDGNCTYLLTRDFALKNVHTFQVYATIGPCETKTLSAPKTTCTQSFHVIYGNHIVHVQKNVRNTLDVIVDGLKLKSLPYSQNWINMVEQGKSLNILLPESQVELISMFETLTFTIKVPSVKYGNKMEGLCGNCNGNPEDDMVTNPAATNLPQDASPTKQFALSWLADEPKLALNERKDKCYVDDETNCLPLPPETDPCFKILDDAVFGKCHFVVDPIMYVTACQQDLCRTGPSQKGSCESLAAYARECASNGVCVDWRKSGVCPMDCVAPFVYSSCGCAETCKTVEDKEKMIQSSTAVKDPANIAKLRSICSSSMREGCFCPKGTVLHNNKCLREAECRACDDKGHLPGDVWYPDVCTSCSCRSDTIQCQKTQCPSQQTICGLGYTAVESSSTGECCKKFACVPEIKTAKQTSCPQLVLPQCGTDQTNKIINGTDGCSKFICDCVPKEQCKPLQKFASFEPGFKRILEMKGCCPVAKLVCDKSLCPAKPSPCTDAFHTLEKTKAANDKICCDEYECRPPPNHCIATVKGKKMMKKVDETWPTDDVCEKAVCAFDTNGNPIIKTQREVCNAICQAGFELKPIANKCCGECVKTKCVVDNKLYDIGAEWSSEDNCTAFSCNVKDGQTYISSMMPTCPDISQCPPLKRYSDGCCEQCKAEPLSQKNCLPESLAESVTIGLIQAHVPPHGNCKNEKSVQGITQCAGSCKSGTKFDPLTFHQLKDCDCCSVTGTTEIAVRLVCDDKFKLIKNFHVPSSCACSKCGADEIKNLKLTAAS